ncbi:uncharacterized protein RJT20DRAFT_14756 [Scheffersomyces xylosifermentans]|uniref:uncharacterized protein n=1 Tax=Scheffersomyces xylosifermentans TaxID=1304137 RepID=UPI00315D4ADF
MNNVSILNFEYIFLIDPKVTNPNVTTYYESNNGLWNDYMGEQGTTYRMIDNLYPIHQVANKINLVEGQTTKNNHVTIIEPQVNNQLMTVSIHGTQDFIRQTRTEILQSYNQINHKTVQLTQREFLAIEEKFTAQLFKLCSQYKVEIVINDSKINPEASVLPAAPGYYIHILGSQDNITITESSIRILIDNILNNYFLDSINVPLSMIPLIGGVQLFNFNQIAKQSNSNIYIPDLLPSLFNSKVVRNTQDLKLWITAKTIPEILLTKNIVNKIIEERLTGDLIVKEVDLNKVKIDLMSLYNQSDILNIMFRFGVFIQMPSLGEKDNFKILVQGNSLDAVKEAILEINLISSNYYSVHMNSSSNQFNEYALIQLIEMKKTCVINSNRFGLEINGNSEETKQLLNRLSTSPLDFSTLKLRLELHNSQRDFISGKKNGKLIKILNQLNQLPMIKFRPFNEYNFFIDFEIYEGTNLSVLLRGLDLIELELPSELRFNIPEVFHKSIIGNGGSIIQSIMKKYNVFIKFSSTVANSSSKDIYSFKRYDNVLIKCPRKNSKNINLVKYEIDQLVYQCCLNNNPPKTANTTTTVYHTLKFQLLKSHYLLLVNNNMLKKINSLESEHNTFINFPATIEEFVGNDMIVEIKGSEAKTNQCFKQLQAILPKNYEFILPLSIGKFEEAFTDANKQDFYNNVVIPFKILLGIEISANATPITNHSSNHEYHQIILSYFNEENLKVAVDSLTIYLRQNGFLILDKKPFDFNPLIETAKPNEMALRSITNHSSAAAFEGKPAHKKQRSPMKQNKAGYNQVLQPVPMGTRMADPNMIYADLQQYHMPNMNNMHSSPFVHYLA